MIQKLTIAVWIGKRYIMILNKLSLLIIAFMLNSCKDNMITTDKRINNKSERIIIEEFGTPKAEQIMKLYIGVGLYEYQSNLLKLYPNLKENDTVLIKEMSWEMKNGGKMVIWFENEVDNSWKSVDNLKWSKKIKF